MKFSINSLVSCVRLVSFLRKPRKLNFVTLMTWLQCGVSLQRWSYDMSKDPAVHHHHVATVNHPFSPSSPG